MSRTIMKRATICLGAIAVLLAGRPSVMAAEIGGSKWAIVIGVQQYSEAKGFAPLRYAESDAEEFYQLLIDPDRGGYDASRVQLLTTAADDPDKWPTTGNIISAVGYLARWVDSHPEQPVDTVMFYFSGHGLEEEGESYLVPWDANRDDLSATALSLTKLRDLLERCGAKKQVIILDACRLRTTPGKAAGDKQSVAFARRLEEFERAVGKLVLSSCSAGEGSFEDEERGHSAFTGILLEGLLGAADKDRDGLITIDEARLYVVSEVDAWARKRGFVQTPRVLYGEMSLTIPLVRCPSWAEVRITSVPDEAEVWIDGRDTGYRTPHTQKIELGEALRRTLELRLKKEGYQEVRKDVTLRAGAEEGVTLTLEPAPEEAAELAALDSAEPPWAIAPIWREKKEIKELTLGWWNASWQHSISWDGTERWGHAMHVCADDPRGLGNIQLITVTDPTGKVHRAPGDWVGLLRESETGVCVEYGDNFDGPPDFSGTYTFEITNRQGESVTAHAELPPFVGEPLPVVTYPENQAVIAETVPTFSWETIPEPGRPKLYLYEKRGDEWEQIWQHIRLEHSDTSARFNSDGAASQPELTPGRTYKLSVCVVIPFGEHAGADAGRDVIFTVAASSE